MVVFQSIQRPRWPDTSASRSLSWEERQEQVEPGFILGILMSLELGTRPREESGTRSVTGFLRVIFEQIFGLVLFWVLERTDAGNNNCRQVMMRRQQRRQELAQTPVSIDR
jgi:hypothetical protein